MAFNPTHVSSPLNTTTVLIADNDALLMDINLEFDPTSQAVVQAQEQLHMVMEAQDWEQKQQLCMEEDQESLRAESCKMVVSDREKVVEAMENAIGEIGLWYH